MEVIHAAIHCSILQHTAAHCASTTPAITLQHSAAHCSTLHHSTARYSSAKFHITCVAFVASVCNALQCNSTLQRTATRCHKSQHTSPVRSPPPTVYTRQEQSFETKRNPLQQILHTIYIYMYICRYVYIYIKNPNVCTCQE